MTEPAPALMFLPGLEGSGDLFAPLVSELGPRFDTRVVRYPVACRTYADVERHVCDLLAGRRPVVVVAESFSTPLAIELAARRHGVIDALILCNGFVTNPLSGIESLMALAAAPWFFHLPLTAIAARTFLVGADASDGLVYAVQSAIRPVAPATLSARFQAVLRCDARAALRSLTVPALYLHATRDRLIGAVGLKQILRLKPDIIVERIEGPHLLLQREPRVCARVISHFVESILEG